MRQAFSLFAAALAALFVGVLQAMDFVSLAEPAFLSVDGRPAGARVALRSDGTLVLRGGTASCVRVIWRGRLEADARALGGRPGRIPLNWTTVRYPSTARTTGIARMDATRRRTSLPTRSSSSR